MGSESDPFVLLVRITLCRSGKKYRAGRQDRYASRVSERGEAEGREENTGTGKEGKDGKKDLGRPRDDGGLS